MRIGNTDISAYNARQSTYTPGHQSISNDSQWITGAARPFFDRNKLGFRTFSVKLIVKGSDREDINRNVSNILAALMNETELTIDGFDHTFTALLKSYKHDETSMRRWHRLTLTFEGFEHGVHTTMSGDTSFTINNPGNIVSPCAVSLRSSVNVSDVKINGVCRDSAGNEKIIVVTNMTANKTVTIDGITGLIEEDGQLKDGITLSALPTLVPGSNPITCNKAEVTVGIDVLPMYM